MKNDECEELGAAVVVSGKAASYCIYTRHSSRANDITHISSVRDLDVQSVLARTRAIAQCHPGT